MSNLPGAKRSGILSALGKAVSKATVSRAAVVDLL